jgi:predicted DNA-binding transcriptional regulator YafY
MLPDTGMKKRMKAFLDSVLSLYTGEKAMTLASLDDRVSVKNIGYSRTDGKVFQKMLDALVGREPVTIEYFSPHKSEITSRLILPLHLLSYMGTWHIVAWCAMRQGLRDFTLSRIRKIDPSGEAIDYPGTDASLKDFLRRSFGILTGGAQQEVCLKFSPEVAPWIEEQVWHPEQKARKDEGGFLLLTFPVADFREVRREILRYGPHVEVVSPGTLRDEVRGEIEKMARLYRPR